jgi:hypothetical protein
LQCGCAGEELTHPAASKERRALQKHGQKKDIVIELHRIHQQQARINRRFLREVVRPPAHAKMSIGESEQRSNSRGTRYKDVLLQGISQRMMYWKAGNATAIAPPMTNASEGSNLLRGEVHAMPACCDGEGRDPTHTPGRADKNAVTWIKNKQSWRHSGLCTLPWRG